MKMWYHTCELYTWTVTSLNVFSLYNIMTKWNVNLKWAKNLFDFSKEVYPRSHWDPKNPRPSGATHKM